MLVVCWGCGQGEGPAGEAVAAYSVVLKRGEPLVEGGVGTARGGTLGVGVVVTLRGREPRGREALLHGGEMKTRRADVPSEEQAGSAGIPNI